MESRSGRVQAQAGEGAGEDGVMVGVNYDLAINPADGSLLRQQGGGCFYCGKALSIKKATKDHLFPRKDGNPLRLNKVIACRPCNLSKGANPPSKADVERARALYANCDRPRFGVRT